MIENKYTLGKNDISGGKFSFEEETIQTQEDGE